MKPFELVSSSECDFDSSMCKEIELKLDKETAWSTKMGQMKV